MRVSVVRVTGRSASLTVLWWHQPRRIAISNALWIVTRWFRMVFIQGPALDRDVALDVVRRDATQVLRAEERHHVVAQIRRDRHPVPLLATLHLEAERQLRAGVRHRCSSGCNCRGLGLAKPSELLLRLRAGQAVAFTRRASRA